MHTHSWWVVFLALAILAPATVRADDTESEPNAWGFLEFILHDPALQGFLDTTIDTLRKRDARLRDQTVRVAILDLPTEGAPRLAHWNGDSLVYPASVVKFVYLMAAYAWRDAGRLEINRELDRQLGAMIYVSSNSATQYVVRRLTETEAGPTLEPADYAKFVAKRHAVKRWLQDMGIEDLHTVHPTYNGGGDLYGRDLQFLEDTSIEGCLPNQKGPYFNRQAMTANDTVKLLALLARDLALSPETSAEVRERMRRDVRKQPYLKRRIAGGVDLALEADVFTKTGSWGPIYADAGIIRMNSGHQLVVAVFVEGKPAYRGSFIADVTRAAVEEVLLDAKQPTLHSSRHE